MGWLSLIVCFLISFWLIWRYYGASFLFQSELLLGFSIKISFALAYILLFTYYFSDGVLMGDSVRFLHDSQVIQSIFKESPSDFFRLMVDLPPVNSSSIELLNNTNIWSVAPSAEWINDNKLIIKLNALINFISFGNLYVNAFVLCFLSFTGIYLTYKTFEKWVHHKKLFWWWLIAFPNLALWGTSFLKESLFIFGFGLWCWSLYKLTSNYKKYASLLLIAALFLLLNKPYAGAIIVSFSLLILLGYFLKWSKKGLLSVALVYIIGLFVITTLPGKLNLTNRLSIKQDDLNNLARGGIAFTNDSAFCTFPYTELEHFKINFDSISVKSPAKGKFKYFGQNEYQPFTIMPSQNKYLIYLVYAPSNSYIEPNLISQKPSMLLKNMATALLNVFIRPFPTDNGDPLKILNFISNILLLSLLIFACFRRKKFTNFENHLLLIASITALTIALIVGWSVPIFGAIVRYKIPAELVLIIISFIALKPLTYDKS